MRTKPYKIIKKRQQSVVSESRRKRIPKQEILNWDFNMPVEHAEFETLCSTLRQHCRQWTFQKEKGATGYLHWQGRCRLKVVGREQDAIQATMCKRPQPTVSENIENTFYCTKEDTRVEGPRDA